MKGIEPEAREAAKKAARQAGVTLGEWLNRQIMQADAAPANDDIAAPEPADEAITSRLDALARRLENLVETGGEARGAKAAVTLASRRAPREVGDLHSLIRRIDRQDGDIIDMRSDLDRIAERLDNGGSVEALETALYNVVDHIELTDKRNSDALKAIQAQLTEIAERAGPGVETEAIGRIEARMGELAERIEAAERTGASHDHKTLEAKLAELANRVDAAHRDVRANPAITTLESRLNQLTSKLTATERSITPQAEVNEIRGEVGRLREEVRHAGETGKPAMFKAIESRMNTLASELAALRNGAASGSAMETLSGRVESMQKRLSEAERSTAVGPRLDVVEKRVGEIARRLDTAPREVGTHPQIAALEAKVGALAEQIGRAMHGEAAQPAVHELEMQVARLADRLVDADRQFRTLDSIEANLSHLFDNIESARSAAVDAAEHAAREAASEFLASQSGPSDVASREAIAALERGLADVKARATNVDVSNQETLEAIHDTLKRVIQRLNALEEGGPAAREDEGAGEYEDEDFSSLAGEFAQEDVADFRLPPLPEAPHAGQGGPANPTEAREPHSFAAAYEAPAANGAKDSPNDDFIAAARRAALAANDAEHGEAGEPRARSGSVASLLKGRRRTLLFAAAAIFIAAGALSVSGLLGRGGGDKPARPSAAATDSSFADEVVPPILERAMALFYPGLNAKAAGAGADDRTAAVTVRPDPTALDTASASAADGHSALVVPAPSRGPAPTEPSARIAPSVTATETRQDAPIGESVLTPSGGEAAPRMMVSQATPEKPWKQPEAPADDMALANVFASTGPAFDSPPSPLAVNEPARPASAATPAADGDPLEAAARAGDALAQFRLATRIADAAAGDSDRTDAAAWYQRAAEQGLPPAQYRLGTLYEKGEGVSADKQTAMLWYERAAEQGNVKAMHNLAVLFAGGVSGQPDYAHAAIWFERAAEHGIADSQFNLAVLYERGLGVNTDPAAAYKWFGVAAAGGDAEAAKRRDALAQRMDAAVLAKARAELAGWHARPLDPTANAVETAPSRAAAAEPASDPQIARAQTLLAVLGYAPGAADGVMGQKTHEAIQAFQRDRGLAASGEMTAELMRHLEAAAAG